MLKIVLAVARLHFFTNFVEIKKGVAIIQTLKINKNEQQILTMGISMLNGIGCVSLM